MPKARSRFVDKRLVNDIDHFGAHISMDRNIEWAMNEMGMSEDDAKASVMAVKYFSEVYEAIHQGDDVKKQQIDRPDCYEL